ncbi:MAG: CDP-alcohol phosphatidyltransferase family protein [Parvularculaceae bacterium]|nr:CDP-alcohol phosphatidyltransferase family protein [Parvularculaceae bacterium]
MTLANRLTLFRAGLVFPYALLALNGQRTLAAILFAIAAATDLLDGYIARRRQEETPLGRVLDPIADKMLTITALIVLTAVQTFSGWLLAGVVIIAVREIWVAGLREGLIANDAELPVSVFAKAKTTAQLLALFLLTFGDTLVGYAMFWIAVALTVFTGWSYTATSFKVFSFEADEPTDTDTVH